MKKLIFISLTLSVVLFGQNKKLTLEESLQIGLQNSSQIKISESVLRSADAKISEVTSQMFPKLSLSAGYTYLNLNDPTEIGLGPIPAKVINPFYFYGMQLSIQQPLFTGFQLSSSQSAAKNSYEAKSYEHQKNINDKALEIYSAFWNYFKAQGQVDLTGELLLSLNEDLRKTKNYLDNGLVTINDYLKLKVQVSNTELKLIDAKNNLELARSAFNKALGLTLNSQTEIEISFPSYSDQVLDYDDLLSDAMNNRQELKSLKFIIEAGNDRIAAANSGWWPKLYASGNFFLYNANVKTFSIENEKLQAWFVGLSLNWDLWDWGYTSSKSSQAQEDVLQSEESLKLLKEQIELEIYNAYLNLKSQKEKIVVSQQSIESAEENYRITKDKYDYQLATTNDLIEAEVELLNSKTMLTILKADYELAKANLEVVVGRRIY
jgi:outer membrane protein TolC